MSYKSPEHKAWDHDKMRAAIAAYRRTADSRPVLSLLGIPTEQDVVLALQGPIGLATSRDERDAFEDIALAHSRDVDDLGDYMHRVHESALSTLGQELEDVLDVSAVVRGAVFGREQLPPINAMVALIGAAAQMINNDVLLVGREEYGQTLTVHRTGCEACSGGATPGKIICGVCSSKATQRLQSGDYTLPTGVSVAELVPQMLVQFPDLFGCRRCHNKPIKPCSCAREVEIPPRPQDGQLVRGRFAASKKRTLFNVRLRED